MAKIADMQWPDELDPETDVLPMPKEESTVTAASSSTSIAVSGPTDGSGTSKEESMIIAASSSTSVAATGKADEPRTSKE